MPTPATEERLAEIGRRIEHLETRAQAATPEAKIVAKRRVDALWKQQASARAAVRETAAGIEEELSQPGTRVDIAEQSAVADVTKDRRTFVDAVEAELLRWDVYLERLQVKAATTAGNTREQAEAAISELRRHWNALGERLGEVRSGGGGSRSSPTRQANGGVVEAVIDKDLTASLLARELAVDALLLLTDVDAVVDGFGSPAARPIRQATPAQLRAGVGRQGRAGACDDDGCTA
jgi:Amino acid kinase family